ncbi:MAG: XrtN system VIT domain-containing protein [Saprospiraceae bacterium]
MIRFFKNPFSDKTLLTGLIFLLVSFICFISTIHSEAVAFDIFSQSFFVNYGLFWTYLIIMLVYNQMEFGKWWRFKSLANNLLLLQLGNLSAYALNRTVPVFNVSTDWLVSYLVLYNLALILFALRTDRRPDSINFALAFILSTGLVFQLYESIYIGPIYAIGIVAFWFYGLSLHAFIPFWFLLAGGRIILKYWRISVRYKPVILTGILLPLVMISLFTIRWVTLQHHITEDFHQQHQPKVERDLPAWVRLSQDLPLDWISERILKSGLVYKTFDAANFGAFMGGDLLNERRQHDPLVYIASVFGSDLRDVDDNNRLHLLRAMFDQRHQTEAKLWRGDNLKTSDIVTNVQLFPEYRLAYTEKTILIHNQLRLDQFRRTQEALYTFYLPEGSVVTSAALWIEGEERPAYLTTKEKADSAYTQIVGYERRDPLLVHWQEGNRVSVRIFPCTPEKDRQFKIGITSPMAYPGEGRLEYHNIDFVGPDWEHARESINVVVDGTLENLESSLHLQEKGSLLTYAGRYRSDWHLSFAAPRLSEHSFVFNEEAYQLTSLTKKELPFPAEEIYLDINRNWSKRSLMELWEMIQTRDVYVYTDRLVKVTTENHRHLFQELLDRHYGLFPLYEIRMPERALVISANGALTPTLEDLEESPFAEKLNDFMSEDHPPVRIFHLGAELSPYWKTLRELRIVDYTTGDWDELLQQLEASVFPAHPETENLIDIPYAQLQIRKMADEEQSRGAPDHLMRLFVYNDLMRRVGRSYYYKEQLAPQLVEMAAEAYVLSPVSSLIVLETQEDYDRFDIDKSRNSLENASITLSGSVPEPHEWLLIILSIGFAAWLLFKDRFTRA